MKIILAIIPLLLFTPMLAHGQQEHGQHDNMSQPIQETQFTPLSGQTFQMYNMTSGSTSILHFNPDGTFYRVLHGQNLTGSYQTGMIITQKLTLCPTVVDPSFQDKWTDRCITSILKNEGDYLLTTDHHDSVIHLVPSR